MDGYGNVTSPYPGFANPSCMLSIVRRNFLWQVPMSWEVISTSTHNCPCGLGSYLVVVLSDDWGRTEERWEMRCLKCSSEFALYKYHYQDSGEVWPAYVWVRVEALHRVHAAEANLATFQDRVIATAKSRHLAQWMNHFAPASSRKDLWRRLTDNGKRYPSLSTFYQHTRGSDPLEYVAQRFTFQDLAWILEKLAIEDKELDDSLHQAARMERDLSLLKANLIRQGHR